MSSRRNMRHSALRNKAGSRRRVRSLGRPADAAVNTHAVTWDTVNLKQVYIYTYKYTIGLVSDLGFVYDMGGVATVNVVDWYFC